MRTSGGWRALFVWVGLGAMGCAGEIPAAVDAATEAGAVDASADAADVGGACPPLRARSLGIGWNHSLAVDPDGALWAWGANGSGQLGLGDHTDRSRAGRVDDGAGPWRMATGGSRHSCGIRGDGSLWCWGTNVHGQLGTGDTDDRTRPTRVGSETDWVEVVCGGLHACGLRQGGTLWCWGANPAGQLGLGTRTPDRLTPQRVGTEAGWRGLAAKARFNCALRGADGLWCWGDNSDGQLGLGDTADRLEPVAVAVGTPWAAVATGPLHSCAITSSGGLWCWGLNDFGQLGVGDTATLRMPGRVGVDTDWGHAAAGFEHTCGLRRDGSLWCWGNDAVAQLGRQGDASQPTPARVVVGPAALESVLAGQGHTCARDAAGAVWCWGDNVSGQAGHDDRTRPRALAGAVCAEP